MSKMAIKVHEAQDWQQALEKSKAEASQAAVQGTRWRAAGCEAGDVGCSVRKVLGGAQRRGRGP